MGTVKEVLVLHGWTYSTEKWKPFINYLEAKGFAAKLLKIPGLTQKLDSVWNIDDYVDWLKRRVNQKIILIGHSNGGRIALAFCLNYPGMVEKLILIDSAGIYHNELPIRIKRTIFKYIAKIGKKIITSEKLRKALYKLSRESDYEKASPVVKQTMINLITLDLTSILSQIKVPTLIIWGQGDKATPLADGKLMHERIKNSKLLIIESARHSPQFTHTKEVVEKIVQEI